MWLAEMSSITWYVTERKLLIPQANCLPHFGKRQIFVERLSFLQRKGWHRKSPGWVRMIQGHLVSSHTFESWLTSFPTLKKEGRRWRIQSGTLRASVLHQKHDLCSCPISEEETKVYHGLQQRWHWHSDAASAVSVHPLTGPLFCQFPSEDSSSGKKEQIRPGRFLGFFFPFSFS